MTSIRSTDTSEIDDRRPGAKPTPKKPPPRLLSKTQRVPKRSADFDAMVSYVAKRTGPR